MRVVTQHYDSEGDGLVNKATLEVRPDAITTSSAALALDMNSDSMTQLGCMYVCMHVPGVSLYVPCVCVCTCHVCMCVTLEVRGCIVNMFLCPALALACNSSRYLTFVKVMCVSARHARVWCRV